MAWIKRNLFFAIGAVIALGFLAAAGVYGYTNWQRNKAAMAKLNQEYATLERLNRETPLPGNDKINNIQTARQQERELRQWVRRAGKYFQPIAPIPDPTNGVITDARFAAARDHILNELQSEAAKASVTLPAQYAFSFGAERSLVKFAPGSLGALAQQLGEVKTICEMLYAARINSLDNIRRVPVSADDAGGPQADYLSTKPVTNNLAVFTPYEVTFHGFSQNLARLLESLAKSPHGFIVTGISVQPAAGAANGSPNSRRFANPQMPGEFGPPRRYFPREFNPQRPPAGASSASPSSGGLQTVLNEQMLSITLDIDLVKLLPGK